jgi:hypothetical protein
MTQDVGRRDRIANDADDEAGSKLSGVGPGEAERVEHAFTESGSATLAALLHLLRLMGAELVLVRGSEIGEFERAVRTKIEQFPTPTANPQARDAGLVRAKHLVEQVLTQIRAQAELKKNLTVTESAPSKLHGPEAMQPRLLN